MDVEQVLHDAAAHVEKGWVRGQLADRFGRVCALGALSEVFYGHPALCDARKFNQTYQLAIGLLAKVMREQYPLTFSDPEAVITVVNDVAVKSRKEIIACMEKAAARASE